MKKKFATGLTTGLFLLGIAGAASASLIGPNVALSGTATQSSTGYWGWSATADLAIDGNTDGNYWNGSVSQTLADNNPYAWWEVDLGQEYSINEIDIWNRTDGYGYLLVPFTVSILEDDRDEAWSDTISSLSSNPLVFSSLSPVTGQFVRIQLDHHDYLQLAEVQVFAAESAPQLTPEPATMLLFATGLAGFACVRPGIKKK